MQIVIPGKPMSANRMEGIRAIRTKDGRNFTQTYPTKQYKEFLERFIKATDNLSWQFEKTADIKITFNAFFSNRASDLDNILKPTLDALQKVFEWNDKHCYEIAAYKHLVKRGEERLEINVEELKR
jgi:Holliday junction resolvase RusA-like endonuclease